MAASASSRAAGVPSRAHRSVREDHDRLRGSHALNLVQWRISRHPSGDDAAYAPNRGASAVQCRIPRGRRNFCRHERAHAKFRGHPVTLAPSGAIFAYAGHDRIPPRDSPVGRNRLSHHRRAPQQRD